MSKPDGEESHGDEAIADYRSAILRDSRIVATYFEGPLPDPETLEKIEALVPGGAEKLLDAVLQEGQHRRSEETAWRKMEADDWKADRQERRVGQYGAIAVVFLALAGAYALADLGAFLAAGIAVSLGLGTVAASFIANQFVGHPTNSNIEQEEVEVPVD